MSNKALPNEEWRLLLEIPHKGLELPKDYPRCLRTGTGCSRMPLVGPTVNQNAFGMARDGSGWLTMIPGGPGWSQDDLRWLSVNPVPKSFPGLPQDGLGWPRMNPGLPEMAKGGWMCGCMPRRGPG